MSSRVPTTLCVGFVPDLLRGGETADELLPGEPMDLEVRRRLRCVCAVNASNGDANDDVNHMSLTSALNLVAFLHFTSLWCPPALFWAWR